MCALTKGLVTDLLKSPNTAVKHNIIKFVPKLNNIFRSSGTEDDFWVGLFNEEQLNGNSICTCDGCEECRNRFDWVDSRVGSGYIDWANNEPQQNEACVRLTHNKLAGALCQAEFGYICYQGKFATKHALRLILTGP